MKREQKIKEIYDHANKINANITTLVFLLALTNDKAITKLHKEFLNIKNDGK